MDIYEMIRIKEERGYSIRQISEYSGVPEGTVRKIFEGRTAHPRVATMIALERVFTEDENKYQGQRYKYDMQARAADVEYSKYLDEAGSAPSVVEETAFTYGERKLLTVEDYDSLPEDCRAELIDGVLYDMGAPSFTHQDIITSMIVQISAFLSNKRSKCKVVPGPVDVQILRDNYNMLQPDVVIVCRDKCDIGHRISGTPSFVLEVVSKWSVRRDYIKKLDKYSDAGVDEYWILDPFKKMLTIYCNADNYAPTIVPLQGKRALTIFGGKLEIDLDEIAGIIEEYGTGDEETDNR